MTKGLLILLLVVCNASYSSAQLPNGTTAPDFTFTDINGNTQHLYAYLDSGKYVAIDVFTTWCHPCWLYDTARVMDSLYNKHDTPGDHTWKVIAIEGDGTTTLADLQGTGTNTQGDWVAGNAYPIMNPTGMPLNDFLTNYNITYYPTLFVICPNKKIYQDTLNTGNKPSVNTWEYVAATYCGTAGIDNVQDSNPLTIYPNPAHEATTLYFALNGAAQLQVTTTNILGQVADTRNFGTLYAGDHSLKYDVSSLKAGIYFITIYAGNNHVVRKKLVVQ